MYASFSTIFALTGLITTSLATPAFLSIRKTTVCASGTPQCCDVDVLGLADLDCSTPPSVPATVDDFTTICADIGKIDMCCTLPILEQGLLCSKPN